MGGMTILRTLITIRKPDKEVLTCQMRLETLTGSVSVDFLCKNSNGASLVRMKNRGVMKLCHDGIH